MSLRILGWGKICVGKTTVSSSFSPQLHLIILKTQKVGWRRTRPKRPPGFISSISKQTCTPKEARKTSFSKEKTFVSFLVPKVRQTKSCCVASARAPPSPPEGIEPLGKNNKIPISITFWSCFERRREALLSFHHRIRRTTNPVFPPPPLKVMKQKPLREETFFKQEASEEGGDSCWAIKSLGGNPRPKPKPKALLLLRPLDESYPGATVLLPPSLKWARGGREGTLGTAHSSYENPPPLLPPAAAVTHLVRTEGNTSRDAAASMTQCFGLALPPFLPCPGKMYKQRKRKWLKKNWKN